ncbi:MAG: hypothetical protein J5I94_24115 [Phaeodactylibacter sp.]|nr:hypothetical protein [Phaeodactylibacter sp.]
MNRRNFFEHTGRWFSGTLLALLGGYLALERGVSPPASCEENSFCGQCRKISGCQKTQAMQYRRSPERTKNRPDGKR